MERFWPWRAWQSPLLVLAASVAWPQNNAQQGLTLPVRRVELRSPEVAELISAGGTIGHRLEVLAGHDVTLGLLVETTHHEPDLMIAMYGTSVANDEAVASAVDEQQQEQQLLKSPNLCYAPLCVDWVTMANVSRSGIVSIVVTSACCPEVEYIYRVLLDVREPHSLFISELPPASIEAQPWERQSFTLTYMSFPTAACSVMCEGASIDYNVSYSPLGNATMAEIKLMSQRQMSSQCFVILRSTLSNATVLPFHFAVTSPNARVCNNMIIGCFTSLISGLVLAAIVIKLVGPQCEACIHWLTVRRSKLRCLKRMTGGVAAASDPPDKRATDDCSAAGASHDQSEACASSDESSSLPPPPRRRLSEGFSTSLDDVSSCSNVVLYKSCAKEIPAVYIGKLLVENGGIASFMVGDRNCTVVGQMEET